MIGYYSYLAKIRPYFNQAEKTDYTLIFLTILTLALFGVLGLRPLLSSTFGAYSQLKEGKIYEATLVEKSIALEQAQHNLLSLSPQLDDLNEIVPKGTSQPDLLQELFQDAGEAGITLEAVNFHEGDGSGEESFDLSASGPTEGLTVFLEALEKGRLVAIDSLQTILQSEEGGDFWTVIIEGRSFFIP